MTRSRTKIFLSRGGHSARPPGIRGFGLLAFTHVSPGTFGNKRWFGGAITDSSGAVIPNASVTVLGNSDKRRVDVDATGRFTIIGLTPGQYTVTVEAKGFKSTEAKNVDVVINRVSNLNLTLVVGDVNQTVEVSANSVEVDTNSTAIGDNLTDSFYQQVPTARGVGSLFYTAPGAVDGGGTGKANPSIGGATGLENSYVADGVGITIRATAASGCGAPATDRLVQASTSASFRKSR